jgi:hypothetical protein
MNAAGAEAAAVGRTRSAMVAAAEAVEAAAPGTAIAAAAGQFVAAEENFAILYVLPVLSRAACILLLLVLVPVL